MTSEIILQICRDIAQGLRYLHSSKPQVSTVFWVCVLFELLIDYSQTEPVHELKQRFKKDVTWGFEG